MEVRRYGLRTLAETTVEATDHAKARSAAFGILAGYIFGKNHNRRRITMTAPVATENGRELAMTAPVEIHPAGPDMLTMRFFLPGEITLANAPLPDDQRVRLIEVPEETLAILGFSGTWTEEHLMNKREELMRSLGASAWHAEGQPFWLFYDPPFAIPFLRRNELPYGSAESTDQEELRMFHRVLDGAMSEATARDTRLPLHTMTKRLFDAASMGERDPDRLRAAIFEDIIFPGAGSFPSGAVACPSVAVEPV